MSGGDFFAGGGVLALYRGRFLTEMMIKMGYSAVGLGENDLSYQLRAIKEAREKGLPVICSNLYDKDKCVFPPYLIKKVHGNKVGIFALLDEPLPHGLNLQIKPPAGRGEAVIKELKRKKCDIIILIAHMGSGKLNKIMPSLDGADMIIRGHLEPNAHVTDECDDKSIEVLNGLDIPVLFAGDKGRVIGKVIIEPTDSSRYMISSAEVIRLKKSSRKDGEFTRYLSEYSRWEEETLREVSMKRRVSHDECGNLREKYLGVDICARCHGDIASRFRESPHSRAFHRLENVKDKSECFKCHATGYKMYSGFGSEEALKKKVNLEGVSCEACHGQGTTHSRDGEYVKKARESCKRCHTPVRSPNFNYEEYMKQVRYYMRPDSSRHESNYK